MKGYIAEGDIKKVTAPSGGMTKDVGYVIGAVFGAAIATVAAGVAGALKTRGVVTLPKAGGGGVTFADGAKVFWDNTAHLCKASATGYFEIGTAWEAAVNADTTVKVRLNGIGVTAVP